MPKQIEESAIFIADAHYPHHGDEFLQILEDIESGKIKTTQLFLMGDIFDLLFGYNNYIKTFSQKGISLLQNLSKKLKIIYIEGNHDFCLQELFPNIQVYNQKEQPLHYKLNEKDVFLSHGDKYKTGFLYTLYSNILRRESTITLLKPFEKKIIDHRMGKLKKKNICGDFIGFEKRANKIRSHYPKDSIIIEGHFHQAIFYKNYISLPSLACQKKVGIVKGSEIKFEKYNQISTNH